MAYYDALISKWPDVTGATTADKLAALNAEMVAGPVVGVPVVTVMTYLWTNGLWLPILGAASAGTSNGAIAADALLQDRTRETIDFSLPTATALLADLVSHSLLSQAQSEAIVAMGQPQVPWWQANGYNSAFHMGDIVMAGLDDTTGYSASIGTPAPDAGNPQNLKAIITVTGPYGSAQVPAVANTLTADYAKFFAANQIAAMMARDEALATFGG